MRNLLASLKPKRQACYVQYKCCFSLNSHRTHHQSEWCHGPESGRAGGSHAASVCADIRDICKLCVGAPTCLAWAEEDGFLQGSLVSALSSPFLPLRHPLRIEWLCRRQTHSRTMSRVRLARSCCDWWRGFDTRSGAPAFMPPTTISIRVQL